MKVIKASEIKKDQTFVVRNQFENAEWTIISIPVISVVAINQHGKKEMFEFGKEVTLDLKD